MIFTEQQIKQIILEECAIVIKESYLTNLYNKFFKKPESISSEDIVDIERQPFEIDPEATEDTKNAIRKMNALIKQGLTRTEARKQILPIETSKIKQYSGLQQPLDTSSQLEKLKQLKQKEISKKRKEIKAKKDAKRREAFTHSKIVQRAMKDLPTELGPEDLEYIKENRKMKLDNDVIRLLIKEELRKNYKESSNVDEGILGGLKGVAAGPIQAYKVGSLKDDIANFAKKYQSSLDAISNAVKSFEDRAKKLNVSLAPELQNAKGFALTSGQALKNIAGKPEMALAGASPDQSDQQPKKDEKPTPEGPTGGGPKPGGDIEAGGKNVGPAAAVKEPESVAAINPSAGGSQPKSALGGGKTTTAPVSAPATPAPATPATPAPATPATPAPATPAPATAVAKSDETAPAATPAATPPPTSAMPVAKLIDSSFGSNDPDLQIKGLNKQKALNIINVLNKAMSAKIQEERGKSTPEQKIAEVARQAKATPEQVKKLLTFLTKHGKLSSDMAKKFGISTSTQSTQTQTAAQPSPPKEETAQDQSVAMGGYDESKKLNGNLMKEHLISPTSNSLSNEQMKRMKLLAGIIK